MMIDAMKLGIPGAAPREQRPVTLGYVGISITSANLPYRGDADNAQFAGARGRRVKRAPRKETKAEFVTPRRWDGALRL